MVSSRVGPATLNYSNVTLEFCIERAYGLKSYQVIVPDWMNVERYTIEAKAASPVPPEQMMAMLQTLLQDRFHLVFHRTVKTMPAYVLEPDGDHHGLKVSQETEDSPRTSYGPGTPERWSRVMKYTRFTMAMLGAPFQPAGRRHD